MPQFHASNESLELANQKILITGATGATGGNAIKTLLTQGIPVRALVHRDDARSQQLWSQGVDIVKGDLLDFDAVTEALKDITGAYFVYPIGVPGILEATAYFAQAAIENGVSAIVNMSQITARREAGSHASRNHWIIERLLDRTGIAVTHLRPTLFAEWLTYFSRLVREKHELQLPFGNARYAPITGEDQGRVIAAVLSRPAEHAGKSYTLYGEKELNQYEIADLLTAAAGHKITYVPTKFPEFIALLGQLGFTPHFQQHITFVAQDCRDGACSGMKDLVKTFTGRDPMSMADYIARNKSIFV